MGRVFRSVFILAGVLCVSCAVLIAAGRGSFGTDVRAGEPTAAALPQASVEDREDRLARASRALGTPIGRQILFGDLHVHSSFSTDAFQLTLPMAGGEGVHPVADACDFARYCSSLDFWSINDHANSITARRWRETVETIRRCNTIASSGGGDPDLVSFLGWEWTQIGSRPENHYGHKNVILRDLEDEAIPARPIAAAPPKGVLSTFDTGAGNQDLLLGLGAFTLSGGHDMIRQLREIKDIERCPLGVPVRDLPVDCHESVETPGELFAKLDEWGIASTVIPHGTVWGMYTPPGSSWLKQLSPKDHDPNRQRLVEVYSGHGNTEEYRSWVAVEIDAAGNRSCPAPSQGYNPACWQAGEIIRARCLAAEGEAAGAPSECETRAVLARQHFVDADRNGGPWTVPGVTPYEFGDAGQCRDCFQGAFNYRPQSSVQAMLAMGKPEQADTGTDRFRFGFIASSDNHTARAGTGYKEVARREFTDTRMAEVGRSSLVSAHARESQPRSEPFQSELRVPSVAFLENERGGSFFLTGGLAAVHAKSRDRNEIWDAMQRRETYGTSGPRILLWFDLLDPTSAEGQWPMGSEVEFAGTPTFRVRAAGSFEQNEGCPESTRETLGPDRLEALCMNECYFPSERRRPITRIEVVRIRSQQDPSEALGPLIEDPWRVFSCDGDLAGCTAEFSDPDFATADRSVSYYARAIEAATPVVDADPLGCDQDPGGASGACSGKYACFERPDSDDCKTPDEQRAWSSPIFLTPAS